MDALLLIYNVLQSVFRKERWNGSMIFRCAEASGKQNCRWTGRPEVGLPAMDDMLEEFVIT